MQDSNSEEGVDASKVMAVLGSVQGLSPAERRALQGAWRAIDPSAFVAVAERPDQTSLLEPFDPQRWVGELDGLPEEERRNQLEEALATANSPMEAKIYRDALGRDIPSSIQEAVTRIAIQRPWYFLFGVLGIGLIVWRLGGAIVRLVT